LLVAVITGSGLVSTRLAGGDVVKAHAVASVASGLGTAALMASAGTLSGGTLNPAITLGAAVADRAGWRDVGMRLGAQLAGTALGLGLCRAMFTGPLFLASMQTRPQSAQRLSELVSVFGVTWLGVACRRLRFGAQPLAVGAWVAAVFWATESLSFANPAATLARAVMDTSSATEWPGLALMQLLGAVGAGWLVGWISGPPA
jgi:glycerol uptake facilitator-like aquaporin